jgi:hypothetical protein
MTVLWSMGAQLLNRFVKSAGVKSARSMGRESAKWMTPIGIQTKFKMTARFVRMNGKKQWVLRVSGDPAPGDIVQVIYHSGEKKLVYVGHILWSGNDQFTGEFVSICLIGRGNPYVTVSKLKLNEIRPGKYFRYPKKRSKNVSNL